MKRTMALTRFGAPGLAFALVASSPVFGRDQPHYELQAKFQSTKDTHTSNDGRLTLHATLAPTIHVQSGDTYSLTSHVESPMGCASDVIFANGFDP